MPETAKGYPYPDPSDPVAQGADNIRALAEAVDEHAGRIASGLVSITPTANQFSTVYVTFPAGRFTETPRVITNASTSGIGNVILGTSALSPTTEGVTIGVRRTTAGLTNIWWIAVQAA